MIFDQHLAIESNPEAAWHAIIMHKHAGQKTSDGYTCIDLCIQQTIC